jgi:hypothetical protein
MAQPQQIDAAESSNIDIDYLAINRARWDERAPHVSHGFCLPGSTLATTSRRRYIWLAAAGSDSNPLVHHNPLTKT